MFYRRTRYESPDNTYGKPAVCRTCPFYEHPMVENDGPMDADMMLVGDSPWRSETDSGLPFQGPAGAILDLILDDAKIDRADIRICNAVKCKPDKLGEAYPKGVVETCVKNFLLKEIEAIKPKLIVPLGNTAMAAFTGAKGITKARGIAQEMQWEGHKLTILPTYHPSFINRNPAYAPYSSQDFKTAKYYAQHGQMPPENTDLIYKAVITEQEIEDFFKLAESSKVFSWDLETTGLDWRKEEILCMAFSFAPRTAHVLMLYQFPIKDTFVKFLPAWMLSVIRRLLRLLTSGTPIFFHNGKYDLHMLQEYFKRYLGKTFNVWDVNWYDTMSMYALLDENTKQSLKEITKFHTDLRYSAEELKVVKAGQLKKLSLSKVVEYAGKDADGTRRIGLKFRKELLKQGLWSILKGHDYSDMNVANMLFEMETFGAPIDKEELLKLEDFLAGKLELFRRRMIRSANIELEKSYEPEKLLTNDFNPRSSQQLADVIFNRLGFPSTGKKTKAGKASTDKKVIEELIQAHPDSKFMRAMKYYRAYDASYKTFAKGYRIRLGKDNRLNPNFDFTHAVSGRVLCRQPNLANVPRDTEFEPGVFVSIRSLFVARPGFHIGYADYSQIEFKSAAVLSGDKKMIHALFVERQDFHTLVARGLYPGYTKAETEFKESTSLLEEIKKTRVDEKLIRNLLEESFSRRQIDQFSYAELYERALAFLEERIRSREIVLKTGRTRAKNFNFGRIYGGQKRTLAIALGLDPDDPAVDEFIERLAETYPDFELYLHEIPEIAIDEGELTSAYGRKRHFPTSLDPVVQSEQGRKGGNFGPQSSAAYVMRAALVRIGHELKKQKLHTQQFNIVYDSNINEHPIEEEKQVARIVAKEMLKPVPQLGNHVFGMEMGNGRSWKEAEHNAVKIFDLEDAKKYVASLVSV